MEFEKLIMQCGFDPKSFYKIAGIDRQSISQYRRGKNVPNFKNATKIAVALGVTIETVANCFKK